MEQTIQIQTVRSKMTIDSFGDVAFLFPLICWPIDWGGQMKL